jgi:osmotically-inducible protein OsmY
VNDPVLAERAVEIDADGRGNVFLHGRVRTSREVAHAVTIAGGVPGVTSVRQRLRVRDRR